MKETPFVEYFRSFPFLSGLIQGYSFEDIVNLIAQVLKRTPEQLKTYDISKLIKMSYPVSYQDVLLELTDHFSRYSQMFERFADQPSRELFFDLVRFRVLPSMKYLEGNLYDISAYPVGETDEWLEIFPEPGREAHTADTIVGHKNRIRDRFPGIRVQLDPVLSDIWEIPQIIDYIHCDYQFYLRREKRQSEICNILYALPLKNAEKCARRAAGRRVVAMAPYEQPWRNVELVKDCGLIPYLLYKRHGCHVRMTGAKGENYSYYPLIDGVQMEFLQDGSLASKIQYTEQHAKQIDLLILRGAHPHNIELAPVYKQHNPDGKIYLGLDANSAWMDRIAWEHPGFQTFMNSCDVIATSGAATARYLNEKWPWKIEHIPNGYYDFEKESRAVSFGQKENIILTVGRLGTVQKATHILLEAFAQVAEHLENWKLRLVGSVEPDFEPYIKSYYERYPHLEDRIEWAGVIEDRKQLSLEYRRARIFALSSDVEGGTPNVIAEALCNGCVIAITRIDSCDEATNAQKCGRIANLEDVDGFADILLELGQSSQLEKMAREALHYGHEHFDMRRITDQLYELIFGAENGEYSNSGLQVCI